MQTRMTGQNWKQYYVNRFSTWIFLFSNRDDTLVVHGTCHASALFDNKDKVITNQKKGPIRILKKWPPDRRSCWFVEVDQAARFNRGGRGEICFYPGFEHGLGAVSYNSYTFVFDLINLLKIEWIRVTFEDISKFCPWRYAISESSTCCGPARLDTSSIDWNLRIRIRRD
jgi:hypothetical protein